jgi:hypothetical protein
MIGRRHRFHLHAVEKTAVRFMTLILFNTKKQNYRKSLKCYNGARSFIEVTGFTIAWKDLG